MSDQSTEISPKLAEFLREFCCLSQYAYEQWITHYGLFHNILVRIQNEADISIDDFLETPWEQCLRRLSVAMNNHYIMEIAKLHDPAKMGKNENLSVYYIAEQKFWKKDEKDQIDDLISKMEPFSKKVKSIRNKGLAHNPLDRKNKDFVIFFYGEGDAYFQDLAKLCKMVWDKVPDKDLMDSKRVFVFSRSGIEGDSLCPSTEARALQDLIINHLRNSIQ